MKKGLFDMLIELRCDKFRQKSIHFHNGLNVVLGDQSATNSIGKSTLLMILDFVFGGNTLVEYNKDIISELGDHDYYFRFCFSGEFYNFRRGTYTPDLLYRCNDNYENLEPLSLDEYKTFLKSSYSLDDIDLTFRAVVSLYSRVWGKENDDVNQPLHDAKRKNSSECIDSLLKLYRKYDTIRSLSEKVEALKNEKSAINSASKQELIPRITAKKYKENILKLDEINKEIENIKSNLAKYAINIGEIVNREISELKSRKDSLLREQSSISNRLNRVRLDLSNNRHIKSKSFESLTKLFPDLNIDRISEVEEFHSKISKILRAELQESEAELSEALRSINNAIEEIDVSITRVLSNIENPTIIVDRVHELATVQTHASSEIKYYERESNVSNELKELKETLTAERRRILKFVENIINDKTREYVSKIYSEDRRSPVLSLSSDRYTFNAIEDTGTGKAYSNLLLLDLAIFETTKLPFVIHDSFLFKNIENESVARLIDLYVSLGKQSFIAIDEIEKYGKKAEITLMQKSVIQLTNDQVLYVKDWRK